MPAAREPWPAAGRRQAAWRPAAGCSRPADQQEAAGGGEHPAVAQKEADGDVALQRHTGQDERGGAGGEHGHHDLKETQQRSVRWGSSGPRAWSSWDHQAAADGGVDPPQGVVQHVERHHQAELQSVADHHGDEHDVARVLVEQPGIRRWWVSPGTVTTVIGAWVDAMCTCAGRRCSPCCC